MERVKNVRAMKGLGIANRGGVKQVYRTMWKVESEDGKGEYWVTKFPKYYECQCQDYKNHEQPCKHIYAVIQSKILEKEGLIEPWEPTIVIPEDEEEELRCVKCGSRKIIKRGRRKTNFGENQLYGCKDCGSRFTPDKGFFRMRHAPDVIIKCLDLYWNGMSLRKLVRHLRDFYGIKIHHTSIMRWVHKYMELISQYLDGFKAKVGKRWHTDEMTARTRVEGKKKYYDWIWITEDSDSRYMIMCDITIEKKVGDARGHFQHVKEATDVRPDVIVTDGWQSYSEAIKREFYSRKHRINNPHIRLKDFEVKPNNNIIERLNGTVRERTKVLRSFDGRMNAQKWMRYYRTWYNLIRPHSGIGGRSPGELVGIPLNSEGNRWEWLIRHVSLRNPMQL